MSLPGDGRSVARHGRAMIRPMDATADDASRLAAIRELLPATGAGIYLATATAALRS